MKTLFLDLNMGAAGDMLAAALYELIENKKEFIDEINAAGIPDVEIRAAFAVKCGLFGTHMEVISYGKEESSVDFNKHSGKGENAEDGGHVQNGSTQETSYNSCKENHGSTQETSKEDNHLHHHLHRSVADIEAIIDSLNVSGKVKKDVKAVYKIIADAESKAHGREVSEIHFHEVGTSDAIADITAVCCLMEKLAPDKVIASPVCTGFGHVHASHGVIPVPAPATAYILETVPSYEGDIEAELCTPTGAALVKYFADEFGRMPLMYNKKTGYGMGMKDFEKCNALRAVLGDDLSGKERACAADISAAGARQEEKPGEISAQVQGVKDKIIELSITVDDMTGEEIGFACERIFEAGALDVYTRPVFMKKNRPGILIDVLAKEEDKDKIVSAIFKHTSSLGIRQALCERYILKRDFEIIETPYGPVNKKISAGYGCTKEKLEYEDLALAARKENLSLFEIREQITGK